MKLLLACAAVAALATPALACPNHDEAAPAKTAQKSDAKDAKKPDASATAKTPATPAPNTDAAKSDKVSSR